MLTTLVYGSPQHVMLLHCFEHLLIRYVMCLSLETLKRNTHLFKCVDSCIKLSPAGV
jgi:hypothetical protein